MSLVAPADSGTFDVLMKSVVESTAAVSAGLLVGGVYQGGLSLAVALLVWEAADAFCALAAAIADGLAASWV